MPPTPTEVLENPDRLRLLRELDVLDREPLEEFDRLTALASRLLDIPVVLVSLVDDRRQFFQSCVGLEGPLAERRQTPLSHSFCKHVVASGDPLIISDARVEPLVSDNPAIAEVGVVAYLGIPLTLRGQTLGSFCAIDSRPRHWTDGEMEAMSALAESVLTTFELHLELRERERAERALAVSSQRFRSLVEQSMDWVWEVDMAGRFTYVSPAAAAITGRSEAELVGHSIVELMEPVEGEIFLEELERLVQSGEPFTDLAKTIQHTDGRTVHLETSGRPIRDANGEVVGYRGVARDVTDRVRAHERSMEESRAHLRRSQKMEAVGLLAGGVAHDFNNVLTAIQGNAALALMDADRSAAVRTEFEQVLDATRTGATLTRRLLAFSRRGTCEPRPLRLAEAVRELEPLLRRLVRSSIRLELPAKAGPATAVVDPGYLEQVIMNLVVNARDAIQGSGTIRVECRERRDGTGRWAEVAVIDDGSGMDEATQARIFEPLFTTKEKGHGTGLGLYTVREIVREAGGEIEVESEVGTGTTFRVVLPAASAEVHAPASRDRDVLPSVRGGGRTVLVVEDDASVRSLVARLLEKLDFRVEVAEDGVGALRRVVEEGVEPELVISDVMMPGVTGPELARKLEEAGLESPVLFTSGYSRPEVEKRVDSLGGRALLEKPFTPVELAGTVAEILEDGEGVAP